MEYDDSDSGCQKRGCLQSTHRLLHHVLGRWAVEYEDGDSGEAEWFELKELLTSWPPPGL